MAVSEQIIDELQRRLESITLLNGYSFDIADVIRPTRIDDGAYNSYTIIINEPSISPVPNLSHPGNPPATAWNMLVQLNGILRQSEKATAPRNEARHNFVSEVIVAITSEAVQSDSWHNWDGLAIDTQWGNITDLLDTDGTESGFVFEINIIYRTDENDPTQAR